MTSREFKVGVLVVPENVDKWILIDHNVDFSDSLHLDDDQHDFNTWHSYAACTGGLVMVYGLPGWERIAECDMIIVTVFGDVNKALDPILMLKMSKKIVGLAYHEGMQEIQYVAARDIGLFQKIIDVINITECDFFMHSTPKPLGLFWETLYELSGLKTEDVWHVPYAYPVKLHKEFRTPLSDQEGIMINWSKVASMLYKTNFFVLMMASRLSKELNVNTIVCTDDNSLQHYDSWFNGKLIIKPAAKYTDFLKELSKAQICLTFDYSLCQGQISYDCAMVGTTCIGSATDGQGLLFPEMCYDTTDIHNIMETAKKCIQDNSFRHGINSSALENMSNYCSFGAIRNRLWNIYNHYRRNQ